MTRAKIAAFAGSTAKRAVVILQEDISLPVCPRKQTDGKGAKARVGA